jgi:uncharacterized phage protein (TIGR02218 family)
MSKPLEAGMGTMVASRVHTLAWGMKLVRGSDGDVTGWSGFQRERTVTVEGDPLVLNPSYAVDVGEIVRNAGFDVGSFEARVVRFDSLFTKADLLAGRWNDSRFYLFQFDWATPANGIVPWVKGMFGPNKPRQGHYFIEFRDLRQWVQRDTHRITGADCDYDFGDPDTCTLDLAPHTYAGSVTSVASQSQFTDSALAQPEHTFRMGRVDWLTGLNAGLSEKVRVHGTGGVITLMLPMLYPIDVADTFDIVAGCGRRRADCIAYGNVLNFPGFDQKKRADEYAGGATVVAA